MNKEIDTYKIFRQLEERKKRENPYSFYDKDELIDEILKTEDELERYKNIIDELENYIKENTYKDNWDDSVILSKYLLDKLKELKGE